MFDDELIKRINCNNDKKILMYSPTQLAYVGDSVYELLVRSYIINNHDYNPNEMHRHAVRFVKAKAQADFVKKLDYIFSEEEKRIVKRGRNAKITSSPKHADLVDYRYATGFEALFGYLYLNNEIDRLMMLFDKILEIVYKVYKKDDKNENNRG